MKVIFNKRAYEVLEEIKEWTGSSFPETLRIALALLHYSLKRRREGEGLAIIKDEEIIRELILPSREEG